MINISKEVRIGLVIVAGFVILIFGLKYLKGLELFSKGTNYYVVYDRVEGLNQGSPLVFRGFKVGSVRKLELHPTKKGKILVKCLVTEDIILSSDTKAQLFSLDLLGAKGINLIEGTSLTMIQPNDTLSQDFEKSFKDQMENEIGPLKVKLESVMLRFDTLLLFVNKLIDPSNPRGLTQGVQDFNQTMGNFKGISSNLNAQFQPGGSINNSLKNIDSLSSTFNARTGAMGRIIDNLDTTTTQLRRANVEQTLAELKSVLGTTGALLDSIKQGKGSIGMMMTDKTLYYNFLASSENLDRLLIDVKQNPKRYVSFSAIDFGKKVSADPKVEEPASFSVLLEESKSPLELKSKEIHGEIVKENIGDNKFLYLLGKSNSFVEIKALFDSIKSDYPKAQIVALRNGNLISLKKAIKSPLN